MIKTHHIIQTGDDISKVRLSAVQTDQILTEISGLYLDRCRAMKEGNPIAVELFNRAIANLKVKLAQL
jgi:hypothetical protein